ncbi:MAG: dihydrodipicolinate synthase family protein [Hyphomicrobiales bacterium]|nr:dihydrodipicolinate synthase family protein [Hyphomicrobiales bacterium]
MAKSAKVANGNGRWSGIYPAVTTKFTEDGALDATEMERCFEIQVNAGIDGIIVCGSLGEASTLDPEEKVEVLKVAKRVAGKLPVLLTISDGSTRNASRMAEAGAKAGAAGFMVLPGLPYKSDRRETVKHFTEVARAGGLPVMIYNNPVAYGVDITPEMLADMASEPLFTSVKESSDNVRRITDIINKTGSRYQVFTGVDNLALESFAMGATGWVAGLVAAFPAETVAVWRLAQQGRMAEALEIYRWFRPLLDLDVSTKLVQNIKLAEAIAINSNDRCRAPRLPLVGAERNRVVKVIEDAIARRPKLSKVAARKSS